MNFKNPRIIILFSLFSSFSLAVLAEESEISLTDLVKAKTDNAIGITQNNKNTEVIPNYSERNKDKIEQELANIPADSLKKEGEELRDEEAGRDPNGIIATMVEVTDISKVTGDNCKGCEIYDKHEMFTKADRHMQDPISQMQLIKREGCKEEDNNSSKGFILKENIETYTDTIEELRICERPITQFRCSRTLTVSCKKIRQCDYGGVSKGSFSEGLIYEVKEDGSLTVGTDGDNYFEAQCAAFEKVVTFSIAKLDLVSIFQLVHVKFDDYLEVKLNGHIVYVGPDGGDYIRIEKKEDGELMVFNGENHKNCERNESWDSEVNMSKVNIDLKPYLKDGENVLQMKIIVSGAGEGWLKIEAKQKCCENNEWDKIWVEDCE